MKQVAMILLWVAMFQVADWIVPGPEVLSPHWWREVFLCGFTIVFGIVMRWDLR